MSVSGKKILVYSLKSPMLFRGGTQGELNYLIDSTNENVVIYSRDIQEFDIDIDNDGNIGIITLDCTGRLEYMYYDGTSWTKYLLYCADIDKEEFKYISIKFSLNSPNILFCWRDLTSPNQWSIVSYYMKEKDWTKEVITRVNFNGDIKPYTFVRDLSYNLYLIYLKNNNMIYDLMVTNLWGKSYEWKEHIFLENCIYIKSFHMDALVDTEGILHISWSDKNKKSYCIKYISVDYKNLNLENYKMILQTDIPFTFHLFFHINNQLACFGITDKEIYYSKKTLHPMKKSLHWLDMETLKSPPKSIDLLKIVQSANNPFVQYHANYILTTEANDFLPIEIDSLTEEYDITEVPTQSIDLTEKAPPAYKKLELALYKKEQEIEGKNKQLKALQGEINYLKEEVKRLNGQNKEYINIIHSNNDKYKKNKDNMVQLDEDYKQALSDLKLLEEHNRELHNKNEGLKNELQFMKTKLDELHTDSEMLKKEIDALENMGIFRKIFR